MDPDDGSRDLLLIEEKGYAEDFMPIKPWVQVCNYTVPTDIPEIDNTVPNANLELEWIHGYSSQNARSNVFYTMRGEIVYPAAAVGVVLNPDQHSQRFFTEHTDEITALAVHHLQTGQGDTMVATAEAGRTPKIQIWSSEQLSVVATLKGVHKGGVSHLSFNGSGELLASVGANKWHSVVVYDWRSRTKLYSANSATFEVLDCQFVGDEEVRACYCLLHASHAHSKQASKTHP
jgi:WD40 repeat protein